MGNKDYIFFEEAPVIQKSEVVKKKTFELEPISVEDAKVFLDTIDNNFYIFITNTILPQQKINDS